MKSKKEQQKFGLNCTYCEKEFKYESERKRHEQSHSPQFQCKVCAKKFSFLSAVRRHEKQHERTGSVVCKECNHKFRDEALLKRHIKYAHKGSFTCIKCDTTFSSELALKAHTKTHRPESERQFRCSFPACGKTFNFTHHLKHHELTHTNTKQHYCNVCGKGFIQSHHLKSHKKKHHPADWLTCEISGCKKAFSTEYAMRRHLGTHKDRWKAVNVDDSSLERKSVCNSTEMTESDTVVCVTCNQVLLRDNYEEHIKKCQDMKKIEPSVDLKKSAHKNELITQTEKSVVRIDIEDVSTCQSYVGGCIMEADANGNEKCVCAQISASITDYELINENITKVGGNCELQKGSSKNDTEVCEGCECADNKILPETSFHYEIENVYDDVPKIEYRNDGTIKIKDTFDIDVPAKDNFDIPYNSCKAVLGKCMVSNSGNMDEGCLCARMAMDDRQMIAQEIDELTPCPSK